MLGVKAVAKVNVLVNKGGDSPVKDGMRDVEDQDYACASKM